MSNTENEVVSQDVSYNPQSSPEYNSSDQNYFSNKTTDWRSSLPPDLQPVVQKYNNQEEFVKVFNDMKSLVGKKFNDFSIQDFKTYSSMMEQATNIPVSPDAYQIDPIPLQGEECVLNEQDTQVIKEISHAIGLNNNQTQQFYDTMNSVGVAIKSAEQHEVQQRYDSCLQDLVGAWGNAYESKIQAIDNAIVNTLPNLIGLDSETIREGLSEARVFLSPILLKVLSSIGEITMDSSSYGYNNIAPVDAQSRYHNMRNDPEFMRARIDRHHPLHERATQEFAAMCEAANG
jgi:hypothetical protein